MASEIEGSFLTRQGNRLINKLLRAKGPLHITRACAGDGVMGPDEDPELFTEPIHYVSDLAILGFLDSDGSDSGESVLALQATSIGVQHGYAVREIAVYAEDPDDGEILYAYASLQDNPPWIRPEKHAVTNLTDLNLVIIVDRIEKITVNLSINGLVTVGMLNQRLAPLEPDTQLAALEHGLGHYPQVMAFTYQYGAGMSGAGIGPAGGTDLVQAPIKIAHNDKDTLTVYTTKPIAKPEQIKTRRKISDTEYIVTYKDNDIDAVYIKLLPTQQPKLRLKRHLSHELATLHHGLGTYPQAIAGILQYGAGVAGAGIGPAGGTDIEQIPIRTVWHDNESLTLYTEEDIQPDALSEVRRVSNSEYVLTYAKGIIESIYIRLLTGQSAPVLTPSPSDTDMMVSVAAQAVNAHNNSQYAHPDIRLDGGKF